MQAAAVQRMLTAIGLASDAAAPIVERELQRGYGDAWLQRVNADRAARNQPLARGLHDHRFVLSLVAHEPLLGRVFDDGQREAALVLNGIGNAIAHNETPRSGGNPKLAEELAQRFQRDTEGTRNAGSVPSGRFQERFEAFSAQGRQDDALATAEQWILAQPDAPDAWLRKAHALFNLGCYDEALKFSERCAELAPNRLVTWQIKAPALFLLERYAEALAAAERLLALDPKSVTAWDAKTQSLERLERREDLLDAATRWSVVHPDHAGPWRMKARTLNVLDRREESLPDLERWIALSPDDAEAWEWKTCALWWLERHGEVLRAATRWVELDPESAFAWQMQGDASLAAGEYETALAAAERWLELESDSDQGLTLKATCLEKLEAGDEVARLSKDQDFELSRLIQAQDHEGVEQFLLSCLEENPDIHVAHCVLARLYRTTERHEDALASAQRCQALDPDFSEGAHEVVLALGALKRWHEALAAANTYLTLHPDDAELWLGVSVASWNLGDNERSVAAAQRATQLAPDDPDAWDLLARGLKHLDRPADCLSAAQRAASLQPNSLEAQLRLAATLTATGDHEAALQVAVECLRLQPGNQDALKTYGLSLLLTDQEERLLDVIENQWPGAEDSWFAQYLKTGVLLKLGPPEQAVIAGERAVALNDSYYPSWSFLAGALLNAGRHAEAVAAAERGTPVGTSNVHASKVLASALYELGHYQGAATAARKFRDEDERPFSLFLLARATEACGDYEEALAAADRWLELEPRGAAWRWKGWALLGLERLEEALQISQMVVDMLPDEPGGWELLAQVYARIGDAFNVLQAAERWANVAPDDPAPRELIAEARARLGSVASEPYPVARPSRPASVDWSVPDARQVPDSKVEALAHEYQRLLGRELLSAEEEILKHAIVGTYTHSAQTGITPSGAVLVNFFRVWVQYMNDESFESPEWDVAAIARLLGELEDTMPRWEQE